MTNKGLNLEILKYLIIFLNECFDIAIGFNETAQYKENTEIGIIGGVSYYLGDLNTTHFFQSPGPIYEPGTRGSDWGRFAPFLYATGVRKGMVLQNCFSHFDLYIICYPTRLTFCAVKNLDDH